MSGMSTKCISIVIGMSFLITGTLLAQQSSGAAPGDWYISAINSPRGLRPASNRPIVVAVVDDGVRTTHESLVEYLWSNPKEKPGNRIDDDGNGFIDDVHGWDISDRNGDATPPAARAAEFYHGTHLASLITSIVETAFGEAAQGLVEIMPVKCVGDLAADFLLRDGYTGLEYAIDAGADIILCAWGIGQLDMRELLILRKAEERGTLIVASGGNLPEEREQFPAAFRPALAVAASGRDGKKIEKSSYGAFIDLLAPGIDIRGASAESDTGYQVKEGSSFAAAIAAGAAAVIKLMNPAYSWAEVTATLKNSAKVDDQVESDYSARLGAGVLDIGRAASNPVLSHETADQAVIQRPQGFLRYGDPKALTKLWRIEPRGEISGTRFYPFSTGSTSGSISFYAGEVNDANLVEDFAIGEFPESVYVAGPVATIVLETDGHEGDLMLEYQAEPLDLRSFYCEGTRNFEFEGSFEDGSGLDNYANNSDCKWLITAPPGKVIQFVFSEFETEPIVDKLYFFNGEGTHEIIMAIFSGSHPPSELTTWTNQVLVWFVTDGKNRAGGWRADFTFVDP
jgi:serine protease